MRKAIVTAAVIAVIAALAVGGWWFAAGPGGGGQSAPKNGPGGFGGPVAVEAEPVTVGRMAREVTAVGSLLANESVMVRPEIAGRIERIAFEEGQRVSRGQLLVRLDDSTLAADLEQAKANLALSKANAERATRLAAQGAGTERAKDEAENKLRIDEAKLEQARTALAKAQVTAPFAGVVGLRAVSVGAYVAPGQDIVKLDAIDPVKAEFRVPELLLPVVKVGLGVAVTADAYPGRGFSGTVYAIDPAIEAAGRSMVVRARIPNPEGLLRPGQFVRLELRIDETEDAVSIPEEAVEPRGDKFLVYRVIEGKAQPTEVALGKRAKGMVEVTQGLAPGDVVVTAGQMKLRPGAAVKVVNAKTEG